MLCALWRLRVERAVLSSCHTHIHHFAHRARSLSLSRSAVLRDGAGEHHVLLRRATLDGKPLELRILLL